MTWGDATAWREALLAWAHLLAILGWTVFLSSTAALARSEWLNAAALARLAVVHRIAMAAGAATLLTGLLRLLWGAKGAAHLLGQPLLWAKLALVAWMLASGWRSGRTLARWCAAHAAQGTLPEAAAVQALRRQVMRAAHLMLWLPLAGVLLARGLLVV